MDNHKPAKSAERGQAFGYRPWRSIRAAVLTCIAVVLIAEASLQGAALFTKDRGENGDSAADQFRVLALGDSHTYGALVDDSESYPARTQQLLDETQPGQFKVFNLGIPGFNTAQVRSRLNANVERYRPQLVLFWAGVNDSWNESELATASSEPRTWKQIFGSLFTHSRLYRMASVWRHDRALEENVRENSGRPGRVPVGDVLEDRWRIDWGDGIEEIHNPPRTEVPDAIHQRRVEENYEAMVLLLREQGVCSAFVEYPIHAADFVAANQAMREVAKRHGVPIVNSNAAMNRVPREDRKLLWAAHPNAAIYTEIARDVAALIQSMAADCGAGG